MRWLRVLALVACIVACNGPDPQQDRWAARYRAGQAEWVKESSLPREPQKKPPMVIYEVSEYAPGSWPTPAQARAAQELVDRCFEAAIRHRWFQFKNAIDQGFGLLFGDKRHYAKREYIFDDRVLDCDRPEFLMYYDTPQGKGLAGMMFYADTPTGWGPQFAGPLSIWHYHVWAPIQCMEREMLLVGTADEQGRCAAGVPMHRSPEMIHVWLIDRPKGPFTSSMYLPDEELALLTRKREPPRIKCAEALGAQPPGTGEPWICTSSPQ
jgi:hypothetical protein